ncbi:hypothetical protein CYMTET_45558 [Cymbomonas tetramitiformis]|uniref:B30.2/SPRY domain-containing protein n=1 Tax=Cymbomonas tetramitiformis TaxID=36881 RepID=A0AAE0BZC7_9CHLO|nr:hypothetical protein CYMTET_45558 [Cymbomonas tetramitiformis]
MTKGNDVAKKSAKLVGVQKAPVNKRRGRKHTGASTQRGRAAAKAKQEEIENKRKEFSVCIEGNPETQRDLVDQLALNPGDAECLAAATSTRVRLNPEDCHLSLVLGRSGLSAATLEHHRCFARVYSGARADFGVARGQWYFEVRLSYRRCQVAENSENATYKTGCRVGWSTEDSSLELAQDAHGPDAFGYEIRHGHGYVIQKGAAQRYGGPTSCVPGDVVGCFLDLEMGQAFFTLNGEELQEAPAPVVLDAGKRYLPHIFLRNMKCVINFGAIPPWFPPRGRLKAYRPLECAAEGVAAVKAYWPPERAAAGVSARQEQGGVAVAEEAGEDAAATADAAKEGGTTSVAEPAEDAIVTVAAAADEEKVKAEEEEEDKADEDEDEDGEENDSDIEDEDVGSLLKEWKEARRLVDKLDQEGNAAHREALPLVRPSSGDDRPEMLMTVGLPGSGKTHWATRYMREAREKGHALVSVDRMLLQLGASDALDRRSVRSAYLSGAHISMVCGRLIPEALEKLLGPRRRNCVFDDVNSVHRDVRARRMAPFAGHFRRVAVVCVVEPDEQKRRLLRQLATSPIGKNKHWYENPGPFCQGFTLPTLDEGFDEIVYVEQAAERAGAILEELRSALPADEVKASVPKDALVGSGQQVRDGGLANHAPGDAGASGEAVGAKGLVNAQLGYREIPGGMPMCTICNVSVTGKKVWKAHAKGRAHVSKVAQLAGPSKGVVAKPHQKGGAHVSKVAQHAGAPKGAVVRASAAAIRTLETTQAVAVMQGAGEQVSAGMQGAGVQGSMGMQKAGMQASAGMQRYGVQGAVGMQGAGVQASAGMQGYGIQASAGMQRYGVQGAAGMQGRNASVSRDAGYGIRRQQGCRVWSARAAGMHGGGMQGAAGMQEWNQASAGMQEPGVQGAAGMQAVECKGQQGCRGLGCRGDGDAGYGMQSAVDAGAGVQGKP